MVIVATALSTEPDMTPCSHRRRVGAHRLGDRPVTGAVDLSIDRKNPNVMYASLWEAYRVALPANLEIRYARELNPPRWELGGRSGWAQTIRTGIAA